MNPIDSFKISLEKHYWLGDEEYDLCSHGEMLLAVNGTVITQPHTDEEWGVSESALALLRSLDGDATGESEKILHGCSTILMLGCPISIYWTAEVEGNTVRLSDFSKIESTDPETSTIAYPGLAACIPFEEYRKQVIGFAEAAKTIFAQSKSKTVEPEDQEMYNSFWQEFNRLFAKHN